ncbi:MAG: hypothetical protein ABR555_01545, partial [Pyrinomonadaceae bacterium]
MSLKQSHHHQFVNSDLPGTPFPKSCRAKILASLRSHATESTLPHLNQAWPIDGDGELVLVDRGVTPVGMALGDLRELFVQRDAFYLIGVPCGDELLPP